MIVGQNPHIRIVEGCTAQQPHLGVAVEKDLFEKILELVPAQLEADLIEHGGVPVLRRELTEAEDTLILIIVPHEMQLIIKYKLSGQRRGSIGRSIWLGNFCFGDGKDRPIDLVHGEKRRRHSRGGLQKFAAIHPHLLAVEIGQRRDSRFCLSVCGSGLNSPLETTRVGTGDSLAAVSAGDNCFSSFLLSHIDIAIPSSLRRLLI